MSGTPPASRAMSWLCIGDRASVVGMVWPPYKRPESWPRGYLDRKYREPAVEVARAVSHVARAHAGVKAGRVRIRRPFHARQAEQPALGQRVLEQRAAHASANKLGQDKQVIEPAEAAAGEEGVVPGEPGVTHRFENNRLLHVIGRQCELACPL